VRPVDEIGHQVVLIGEFCKPEEEDRPMADETSMALEDLLRKAQLSEDVDFLRAPPAPTGLPLQALGSCVAQVPLLAACHGA
jgi:hypothetical protein